MGQDRRTLPGRNVWGVDATRDSDDPGPTANPFPAAFDCLGAGQLVLSPATLKGHRPAGCITGGKQERHPVLIAGAKYALSVAMA